MKLQSQLQAFELDEDLVTTLIQTIKTLDAQNTFAKNAWRIVQKILSEALANLPDTFKIHLAFFQYFFPEWPLAPDQGAAWTPEQSDIANSNLYQFLAMLWQKTNDLHKPVATLLQYAINNPQEFWSTVIKILHIHFKVPPEQILATNHNNESPTWLPGASMNIADSCFIAEPNAIAIIAEDHHHQRQEMTFNELNKLSNQVANGLVDMGLKPGDAIGIAMPMHPFAVAIYLGIIKMGGVVVSIADSFSSDEIATRLKIANAKAIFTQDYLYWGEKRLPMVEKVLGANAPTAIVIKTYDETPSLRASDLFWDAFLSDDIIFTTVARRPMDACNILFSSGTTGTPKAIVWHHTTPIKAASDAFFHQNIKTGDRLAWPTNLGWMMGPWLIFAAFINCAAIVLYNSAPKTREFGEFVASTKVTMLGVIPTLVKSWRHSRCMEGLNWQHIKVFSSTGECSNPEDMFYLMYLADYKPVIEYCGGTEIGGAYLSSTVLQTNYPSLFSTPTMGMNVAILDEAGHPAKKGEIAIIPPSIGLSTLLLNADHYKVYYDKMPIAFDTTHYRRHGDEARQFANGYYEILGRADDTMNLGGIKISSAEIERTLLNISGIIECAAVGVTPQSHGPTELVIFVTTDHEDDLALLRNEMQGTIARKLNPLFKIHDVVKLAVLPKTASNKIIRRKLRDMYLKTQPNSRLDS